MNYFDSKFLRDGNKLAISWQRPTTNIKSDMVCVKLIEITEWILIEFCYIDYIVMLTFIP